MQFKWNYTPPADTQVNAAKDLGEKLGISPILASLLIRRGITTESAAKRFFRPQLADLINPFLMKDMDAAVDRLNDAMGHKERILVYGDYDVDGCTAVALVYKFLRQFYSNIDYYIPDRYDEGYGVSKKGIDFAKETGVKLIIILDCGIKAIEEITYAKEQGIDFIICDHHVPDEVMPPAVAILNPKRPDDSYPFKNLCGCGVGFKFMQAFAKNNNIPFSRLVPLLDFCAVSIAADLVPVVDENRILAFHGLKQLNQNPSLGLKAIVYICDFTQGMKIVKATEKAMNKAYDMTRTKRAHVDYEATQLTLKLVNEKGFPLQMTFSVGNHDVAYRYTLLPSKGENPRCGVVYSEASSFNFPDETHTFLTPQIQPMSGWERTKPSYEEEYRADARLTDKSTYGVGYTFPCLYRIPNGRENTWVLVSETGTTSYPGCRLSEYEPGKQRCWQ